MGETIDAERQVDIDLEASIAVFVKATLNRLTSGGWAPQPERVQQIKSAIENGLRKVNLAQCLESMPEDGALANYFAFFFAQAYFTDTEITAERIAAVWNEVTNFRDEDNKTVCEKPKWDENDIRQIQRIIARQLEELKTSQKSTDAA